MFACNAITLEVTIMNTATVGLLLGLSFYAPKDTPAPQYDRKSEIELMGNIIKVYQGSGTLAGTYAVVETKGGPLEVYFAPESFVQMLEIPLKAGMKDVSIIGAKVIVENKTVILAREVRIDKIFYSLRDASGTPNWLWTHPAPTGF